MVVHKLLGLRSCSNWQSYLSFYILHTGPWSGEVLYCGGHAQLICICEFKVTVVWCPVCEQRSGTVSIHT